MEIWRKCSREENSQCKGPEVGRATRLIQLMWGLLPERPLEALDLTKSPLLTVKMNKANPGPLPTQHPDLSVVL